MNYIKTYHRETAQYTQGCSWTGGLVNTGTVGAATYKYLSNGWTVTITYPIVTNPVYTVTVTYVRPASWFMPAKVIVYWQGTWQNGAIGQTNYKYTP
jgi:hypothetical protein